jgi:hypothetical protein
MNSALAVPQSLEDEPTSAVLQSLEDEPASAALQSLEDETPSAVPQSLKINSASATAGRFLTEHGAQSVQLLPQKNPKNRCWTARFTPQQVAKATGIELSRGFDSLLTRR